MAYIVPLDLLTTVPVEGQPPGKMIAWYIEGAEAKIMVDTGISDAERTRRWHPYINVDEQSFQTLESQLSKVKVKPEDIEIIILTHLHWDHCGGLLRWDHGRATQKRFPNAEIFVQRTEYAWAIDPIPTARAAYEHMSLGVKPAFLEVCLKTLKGEKEIVKGITVFPTPGHTPGGQSVAVETEEGTYVIAGDTVSRWQIIKGDPEWFGIGLPYLMPTNIAGGYINSLNLWESLTKIEEVAGGDKSRVLPSHDSQVFEKARYG